MLNRFEAFNLSIISKMQNARPAPATVASTSTGTPAVPLPSGVPQDVVMGDATGGSTPGVGGIAGGQAGGGAAKKKKPKKKK